MPRNQGVKVIERDHVLALNLQSSTIGNTVKRRLFFLSRVLSHIALLLFLICSRSRSA